MASGAPDGSASARFTDEGDRIIAALRGPDGRGEDCEASYIVGCDGCAFAGAREPRHRFSRRQPMEADPVKRKAVVWDIGRKLAEHGARPVIFCQVSGPAGSRISKATQ